MPARWSSIWRGLRRKEAIEVEPEALALIARAAEGSVRDSLSLLDQAIAHAAGPVRAEHVRQMLGLADRARVIDLFEALMRGDIAAALTELRAQYDTGADPAVVLTDLAEFTHFVTRVKIVPAVADDPALIEVERTRGRGFAEKLSMRVLSRTWQMLLKGHRRGRRRRPSARGGGDGAGAHRLCRRSADARRSGPLAVGRFKSPPQHPAARRLRRRAVAARRPRRCRGTPGLGAAAALRRG